MIDYDLPNRITELSTEIATLEAYVTKGEPNAHTWQPYIDILKREHTKLTIRHIRVKVISPLLCAKLSGAVT